MANKPDNSQRDALICSLYRDGVLMAEIGAHVGLGKVRIGQILKAAGLTEASAAKPGLPEGFSILGMSDREAAVALEPYVSASTAALTIGTTKLAVIGFWWRNRHGNRQTLAANGVMTANPSRRPRKAA